MTQENNQRLTTYLLTVAFVAAFSMIVTNVVLYLVLFNSFGPSFFVTSSAGVFGLSSLYFCWHYADNWQRRGGDMDYLQSLLFCMRFYMYSGLVLAVGAYVFFRFVNPDFFTMLLDELQQQLAAISKENPQAVEGSAVLSSTDWEQMREGYSQMSPISSAFSLMFCYILCGTTAGVFLSFLIKKDYGFLGKAGMPKKKKKEDENGNNQQL